jgi:uncharacterized membrane protein YcgQ (UPF0703/DUF1980 family)
LKNKYKVIFVGLTLVLLIGIYAITYFINKSVDTAEITDKGIYYGVVEGNGNIKAQGKNDSLFESPLKNEKEIKITDRNFLSWYDELELNPERYSGRPFEMTGNIFNMQIENSTKTLVGRYVLTSPLEKKEMEGIIIKTDVRFSDDEWVHIKGTMEMDTIHGMKVPAVRVEFIEKAQNKGADFIYGY